MVRFFFLRFFCGGRGSFHHLLRSLLTCADVSAACACRRHGRRCFYPQRAAAFLHAYEPADLSPSVVALPPPSRQCYRSICCRRARRFHQFIFDGQQQQQSTPVHNNNVGSK
ncbi:unnamed protein product [Ectocarpus sp. 12 AP-2014]